MLKMRESCVDSCANQIKDSLLQGKSQIRANRLTLSLRGFVKAEAIH